MKQERKRQIMQFVEEKGFYIILALCVAAIGISGYVLFFTEGEPTELPVVLVDPPGQTPAGSDPMDQDLPETPVVKPDPPELPTLDLPTEPDEPVMRPEKPARTAPVEGTVLRAFSGDDLVYDKTMGDWRTHNGTDFSVAAGAPVLAVCDATVGAVWTDGLRGSCLRLDCGDKTYVTYCGLAANDAVTPGMTVKVGQEIGKVGNTMLTESMEESHLHIEVIKNGRYQDPEQFLK